MRLRSLSVLVLALCVLAVSACKKDEEAGSDSKAETSDKNKPAADKAADEKPKPADKEPEPAKKEDAEPAAKKDEHGKLPPAVQAFHDVFGPIWHIEDKKARMAKFCEKADKVLEVTDALEGIKAPEGADAKAWEKAIFGLSTYIADTDRACSSDKKNFEKYLAGAHDSLHKVMELVAGKQ